MTGTILIAAVIVAGCLLGAAAMVLRAARVHAAAVDRQRSHRPFPTLAPEYREDRPQPRRRPRRGRLLLLLAAAAAAAAYWYAGPALTAHASRLAHGQAGLAPTAGAVIIVIGFAAIAGWSLSRRRYPRNHGW